jgi:ABC-2 type transport system permease protein
METSYRLAFLLEFAGIFFSVAVFYFVGQLVGTQAAPLLSEYGGDYFAFVLVGIAFARYFGVGISSFASNLRQAQTTGTLEAMLTTPTNLSTIILSSSLWNFGLATLQVLVYLFVGGGFLGVQMGQGNVLAAVVILILSIVIFSSLGILAASFVMVLKRGDPITWLFNVSFTLLGGVYYPITILPGWLQSLSSLLPVTYGLRAMRFALLQGAGWYTLMPDLMILALFSIVLLPLSLLTFRFAVHHSQQDGSLTHY